MTSKKKKKGTKVEVKEDKDLEPVEVEVESDARPSVQRTNSEFFNFIYLFIYFCFQVFHTK